LEKERWKHIEQGDIAVYSETYTFYFKKLFNYGKKFTDNTELIEDAIQSVFIMLWNDRKKLAAIHSPNSYIFCSFRNYIFKEKGKLQRIDSQTEEPVFAIEDAIVIQETNIELSKRLQKALSSLTSHQREAIFLRFYEALSYEEVAQVMEISVKATYKLMARSLLKLKELMDIVIVLLLTLSKCIFFKLQVVLQILN
jgi:RNA polymerase sigma factor (sigma-70 family)